MRYCTLILGVSLVLLPGLNARGADDKDTFFNGKDLSGWDGLPDYWSVKDGAIVGATPKGLKFNTFLCSDKKYKDFELRFKVRLKDGTGNSGVQIRSRIRDGKEHREQYAVEGPQCDMAIGYWGSLFGEHFYGKKPG